MEKTARFLIAAALALMVAGAISAQTTTRRNLPQSTGGAPIPAGFIKMQGPDSHSMVNLKAQNHLLSTTNAMISRSEFGAHFKAGTALNTIPYFTDWFITGSRNSVYGYAIVGAPPNVGGTTTINNQIIPLVTVLVAGNNVLYVFDPTVANDPQGSDISLLMQSPLYDATTTYPGPPTDTGQYNDTAQRASFAASRTADWHTVLGPPSSSGVTWVQFLTLEAGDWACVGGEAPPCTSFPVVNISTISGNFGFILQAENPPNNEVPIIVTDFITAFDPNSGSCCVLGYHSVSPGTNPPGPNSVLVWTWSSFLPHSNNPFAPFGNDAMILSHETNELFMDPFVNTRVAPWVDGSVTFAQANLETGDVIEAMNATDVIFNVSLNPNGQPYTYSTQNVALLSWFTRNPFNGGVYSWPKEGTLSQAPHPLGCNLPQPQCWSYGQGSAGFFFGPPY